MEGFRTGLLYCGDCLDVMRRLQDGCIDLIYIDPPFFSNRNYEVIFGDLQEVRRFRDRMAGGRNVYLNWLMERIDKMQRLLTPKGSIYIHLDWHLAPYVRVKMDETWGFENFQNEIIWYYSVGGKSNKRWARKHDNILFYAKSKDFFFDGDAVKRFGVRKTGRESFGGRIGTDEIGRRFQDKKAKSGKYYRYYLDEGKIPEDVWEIQSIQSQSRERHQYPTQKPEALLERIILASCPPDGVVADFFCGCGTTLAVAQKLGRRWIGCDVSPTAIDLVESRLRKAGATDIKKDRFPYTDQQFRDMDGFVFQGYVIDFIHGRVSDRRSDIRAIDGYTWWNRYPFQVKRQESVGLPIVQRLASGMQSQEKTRGYIFALSFSRDAREEVARLKSEENLEIELWEVPKMVMMEPPPEFP